ncbi:hypothetical protein [Rhodococcus sp. BP22]|uniref:hypothetical protein n=1 Tax=Rhodococcus sp. BP22 TaxID=2758566 RepID=UPI0016444C45|nr:hypothetical protein [Rhodococcus sp. BP22]
MAAETLIEYWTNLATAADEGQLFLDPRAAMDCDKACAVYIENLVENRRRAMNLADVRGMGSFESGIALARKFSLKADGGTNNLVDVLQSHIDVVTAMQTVFRKFFDATETTDQDNGSLIGQEGPR